MISPSVLPVAWRRATCSSPAGTASASTAPPHLPHGWDAGLLFEETRRTLFGSDLFHQFGDVAAVTSSDLIGPARRAMQQMQSGPLADTMPYTSRSAGLLQGLAALQAQTLAVMHGSSSSGSSEQMLRDLAGVMQEGVEAG